MRINSVVIRKILKRDAFLKIEKKNPEKWHYFYDFSLEIIKHWFKFLSAHINYTMKWQCADKILKEEDNKFPNLSEEEEEKNPTFPDYVFLMLNYKKFVTKKVKSC